MGNTYREQSLRAKNLRRDPSTGDKSARGRAGKTKGEIVIEYRGGWIATMKNDTSWHKWRAYADKQTAEKALQLLQRKYKIHEWRIR